MGANAYKTYEWEAQTFPKLHKINIKPEFRIPLTLKLAKYFNIKNVEVSLTTQGGGWCRRIFWGYQILLGRPSAKCHLSTVLHELAHAYTGYNEKQNCGHNRKFKLNLIKLNVEHWKELPRIFREIRHELELQKLDAEVKAKTEMVKAQKKALANDYKKTREYKITKLHERIKRLERKEKSIGTRLKSARRSLKMLERFQALQTENKNLEKPLDKV